MEPVIERNDPDLRESLYPRLCAIFLVVYGALLAVAGWFLSLGFLERKISPDGSLNPGTALFFTALRISLVCLGILFLCLAPLSWRRRRRVGPLRAFFVKSAVLVTVVVLCFIALEAGARIVFYKRQENLAEAVRYSRARAKRTDGPLKLIDFIQLSENDRLIYELMPGARGFFEGARVEINDHGYRGRLRPYGKPPGLHRIVGLGDSIPFGFGVDEENTYLFLLERLLDEEGWPCEVLNLAVPGYNTAMEVEMMESRGFRYEPDLIILGFCQNDFNLPNFLKLGQNFLTLKRSFFYDWLVQYKPLLYGMELTAWGGGEEELRDLSRIPPEHRDMVGEKGVIEAFRRLGETSRTRGIPVVIEYHRDYYEGILDDGGGGESDIQAFLRRISQQEGFHYCDTTRRLCAYASESGEPYKRLYWVKEDDPHPSRLANRRIAEGLRDCIVSEVLPGERGGAGGSAGK